MNRQDVLDRALETLDRYGFADLSMRRLAATLGVQPGALYWHFANKQTLLLAVAEVILEPVVRLGADPPVGSTAPEVDDLPDLPTDAHPRWERAVRTWAETMHAALLAHRDGAELVASALALRPRSLDPARPCVVALREAGATTTEAGAAAAALLHYTVGHAVDAQNHAQARALGVREVSDQDDEETLAFERFRFGLEVFLAGLAQRLP